MITDPGDPETFAGTVGYGDGTGVQALSINQDARTFDLAHTYAVEGEHLVTVTVDDGDGGTYTDTFTVTVQLNQSPVVNDQSFGVAETSPNGTAVGTVVAADPDAGDTLTYSMTGGDPGGAGSPSTARPARSRSQTPPPALDFETTPSFALAVEVRDDAGGRRTPPRSRSA